MDNIVPIDTHGSTEPERELWSARKLARYFSVHPATVLRWAKRGVIPCHRLTRQTLRFDANEIEKLFIEKGWPGR